MFIHLQEWHAEQKQKPHGLAVLKRAKRMLYRLALSGYCFMSRRMAHLHPSACFRRARGQNFCGMVGVEILLGIEPTT